ncbi:hypothetical protein [Lignipirellula cremea]|uniref:Uncharacterized protein n=1 Tax=Lignipirellula cremea TaxID=2528010 RepID=A0A518DWK0_9BACT|nr:hypothetical protein [Lignipirellula cremea]QDU96212.1 hypothetical protein Pla8534_40310 [Lignipirellula cremea]
MKSLVDALIRGLTFVKLVFRALIHSLSLLVPLYCVGRCCFVPSIIVAVTLLSCFSVGCAVCRFSTEHVGFDLLVAFGAVIVHHATNDIIRRIRQWIRHWRHKDAE